MSKTVLVLCTTEQTYASGLSSKIIDAIFGETKEEYDFYYIGISLRSRNNTCKSKISDMINCKNILNNKRKFDIILSENCPYKGKQTIYDSTLKSVLNQYLKSGGVYISQGDPKFKRSNDLQIDDAQDPELLLSKWLGNQYNGFGEFFTPHGKFIVFQKRAKSSSVSKPSPKAASKPSPKPSSKAASKSIEKDFPEKRVIIIPPKKKRYQPSLPTIYEDREF